MIIFPTPMQQRVLEKPDDKPVCLIMNGRGAGSTTALIMAAIAHKSDFVWFPIPSYPQFKTYSYILKSHGFSISNKSMIAQLGSKKIKFILYDNCTIENLQGTSGAFFVEGLEYLPKSVFEAILSRGHYTAEYYFTCSPLEKVSNGSLASCFFSFDGKDFAAKEDVNDDVHLVTGYSIEDNKYLKSNNPEFKKALEGLPERYERLLTGKWSDQ